MSITSMTAVELGKENKGRRNNRRRCSQKHAHCTDRTRKKRMSTVM